MSRKPRRSDRGSVLPPVTPIQRAPFADLREPLAGQEIVSLSGAADGSCHVLTMSAQADDRKSRLGLRMPTPWASAARTVSVLYVTDAVQAEVHHSQTEWSYVAVEPLPDEELLLVCVRCSRRGPNDCDRNAHVFSSDGHLQRAFCVGDGIEDLQATREGEIWTSYFDEGIFGGDEPIGASGLVCWDRSGKRLYEYSPSDGLDTICDCYALNVAITGDVWAYYYTQFPLVCIRNRRIRAWWQCPVHGSDAFAVWRDLALFRGGYKDHDTYHLFQLAANGAMELLGRYAFLDEQGSALKAERVAARDRFLFLIRDECVYRIGVADVAGRG